MYHSTQNGTYVTFMCSLSTIEICCVCGGGLKLIEICHD